MTIFRNPFQSPTWLLAFLLPAMMAGCADSNVASLPVPGGTTPPPAADIPPTVTLTVPARATTGIPISRSITATFSEPMDAATVNLATISIRAFGSAAVIDGTVTLDPASNIATFDPVDDLAPDTPYSVVITTGVKNSNGTAMVSPYTWSFETALTGDATRPLVVSTGAYGSSGDTSGATGLPVNRASTVTFNEAMLSSSITSPATTFTVRETLSSNPVAGLVSYAGNTATFTPTAPLALATEYTSEITISAVDLANNALAAAYVWSWTTGDAADLLAPTITVTNPMDQEIDVPVNQSVNITFSEEMLQTTMVTNNFLMKETLTNNPVSGTVAYDVQHNIATFVPENNLLPDTDYTVTVTNSAADLAGLTLVVPAVLGLPVPNPWTFRTAADPIPPEALAINLRGIATFGIASRAGMTSTGVTVVNGDVAIYPTPTCTDSTGNAGASQTCLVQVYSSPTGMTVNGSIYWFGDAFDNGGTANSVTNDLNIAWIEGKNKVPTMPTIAGNELASAIDYLPGVYHNPTLGFQAGGVATMNANNDANAVFIFQVDASFVDSGTLLLPTEIVLKNGAQARNIWFIVGSDVTIGSGSTWYGNILAGGTATVNNGSTVTGRVLAGAAGAGAFTIVGAASPSVTTITVPE